MATRQNERPTCPGCREQGRHVSAATIRSLFKQDYLQDVIAEETTWWFCDSKTCDIVYFAGSTDETFTRDHLTVAVGVKESAGERPLCYCFGHSVATIKSELQATGTCNALNDIRQRMHEDGCRCELTNPSGTCCLGSVARGIETAKSELELAETPVAANTPRHGPSINGMATAGMVLSAVMSSSCCWLPLLLLFVGVSGAGVAAVLEEYRAYFATATLGFLGVAFYLTYRQKRVENTDDQNCCADSGKHSTCHSLNTSIVRRDSSMKTLQRASLWTATAIAVAFLFFPNYLSVLSGSDKTPSETADEQLTIRLEGMTCEGCSVLARKAIEGVPGIEAVRVDFKQGTAVICTKSCCKAPRDEVLAAITKAGFKGSFVEVSLTGSETVGDKPAATCKLDCCKSAGAKTAGCCKTGCEACVGEVVEAVPNTIDPNLQAVLRVDGLTCPAVKGVGCGHALAPLFGRLDQLDAVQNVSTNWSGTELRVIAKSTDELEQAVTAVLTELKSAGHEPARLAGEEFAKALNQRWRDAADVSDLSAHEFETLMNSFLKMYAQREDLDEELTQKLLKINEERWSKWRDAKSKQDDAGKSYAAQWSERLAIIGEDVLTESAKLLKPEQAKDLREIFTQAWQSLQQNFGDSDANAEAAEG